MTQTANIPYVDILCIWYLVPLLIDYPVLSYAFPIWVYKPRSILGTGTASSHPPDSLLDFLTTLLLPTRSIHLLSLYSPC